MASAPCLVLRVSPRGVSELRSDPLGEQLLDQGAAVLQSGHFLGHGRDGSRICSRVCSEVMKKRRREARSGTAGWMIGCTLMPRSNSRFDRAPPPSANRRR